MTQPILSLGDLTVINQGQPPVTRSVKLSQLVTPVVPDFTYTPTKGLVPFLVTFTDITTPVAGVTAWIWNFGDGSATSTVQNPTHTYTSVGPGSYTVTLTVTVYGMQYQVQHVVLTNVDPYFSGVALLLLMKEAAGTTVLVDSSQYATVPTPASGGAQSSGTFTPFSGVQPYLPVMSPASVTPLTFGAGGLAIYGTGSPSTPQAFTLEFWFDTIVSANYTTAPAFVTYNVYDAGHNLQSTARIYQYAVAPALTVGVPTDDPLSGLAQFSYTQSVWHFFSMTWSPNTVGATLGTLQFSIDGVLVLSLVNHTSLYTAYSASFYIGAGAGAVNATTAYIGPLRLTFGVNRYPTGNYAVPTSNFPSA